MEKVNHPGHYLKQGRKECIEEMIEYFGIEAVKNFCLLNAFKYMYRQENKGGKEDIKKAIWYVKKYRELGGDILKIPEKSIKELAADIVE